MTTGLDQDGGSVDDDVVRLSLLNLAEQASRARADGRVYVRVQSFDRLLIGKNNSGVPPPVNGALLIQNRLAEFRKFSNGLRVRFAVRAHHFVVQLVGLDHV